MQKFTAQDAKTMLELAQAAPLQNYLVAKSLDALFTRYVTFINESFRLPPNEQVAAAVAQALAAAKPNGAASGMVELPVPEAPDASAEPAPAESAG